MTLGYSTVKDADLAPLSEAVTKWRNLPGQFDTIATSFQNEVSKALRTSDWEGEAAEAAFKKFDGVEKQLKNASEEAKDVHRLLDNALESFRSAQKRLRDVASEVAEDRNLKLSPAGLVYLDPDDKKEPSRLAVLKQAYEDVVRGYNNRISTALADATEADTALHWALSQDPNGRSSGFHPDMFHSIKDAQRGRREARKDADTLVKLTALGRDMTDEQLAQFNRLARKHEGDPYFAERYATKVGPEGTLRFWQGIADQRRHSDKDALKTLADVQKSLSYTLATASHSESDAMREWKKEMIRLGDERVYFTHSGAAANLPSQGSYGFSIMSSLMRHGEYDTGFLKEYGEKLIKFEKDYEGSPEDLWYVDDHKARLSFGSDSGNDPMAGYLEALGHNPEAAKEMFQSAKWANNPEEVDNLDPDLNYLMREREWLKDSASSEKEHLGYGYDELGHALEAATLGVPYDRPDLGLHRDATTANVMSQVVSVVGFDSDYVTNRPGVGDSLAKAGAGYMDDLSWATSNYADIDHDSEVRDRAFRNDGKDGHIRLGENLTKDFLENVGKHPGGYEILSAAQETYAVSALKNYPEPNEELNRIIDTSAKFHSILDNARAEHIDSNAENKSQEYAEAAEWKSFAVSHGVGLGVGLATLPFGGPTTSAAVSFLVPTIIEGAGDAVETKLGIDIDQALREKEKELESKTEIEKEKFEEIGKSRAAAPLSAYAEAHNMPSDDPWFSERRRFIELYYGK
ncbi:hypothetical protein V1L54_13605 [Streptomyces sp. TRM 70361]|uniref:PPE domain-containing protein n=1 Tax=Streptomyces sp. TRM 70361 TaxID=3116553 RepID=UPI002E7BD529|nr:hypothetical protein [Streptomyces sp. TRM 70361]MEE1940429.1 hypothetical protein [Streptomyces sp. TRM 70361]